MQMVVVETGGRPVVVGGDVAVWFGELDEPSTEGQLRVRALDPELVWLAHEHEPWRPRARRGVIVPSAAWRPPGGKSQLKRHPALVPLSHDHHAELVLARRLRLASGSDVAEARLAAASQYLAAFAETVSHFRIEEERLFPALGGRGGDGGLVERALAEHEELRGLAATLREEAAAAAVNGETMLRLANLLHANVRFEERELFPLIEQSVSDTDLRALDLQSSLATTSAD
jgi:hemerythrin-like domain-containing protein